MTPLEKVRANVFARGMGIKVSELEYIYFAAVGDWIKIGRTRNVHARLAELQIGSPIEIRLRAVVHGSMRLETLLHSEFRALRGIGEWFRAEPPLLPLLDTMANTARSDRATRVLADYLETKLLQKAPRKSRTEKIL